MKLVMDRPIYEHKQRGTTILVAMAGMSLLFVVIAVTITPTFFVSIPILLLCGWLFGSMTVAVTETEVRWQFGPGLIHKRVPRESVQTATPVKTNVLEGWGIHYSRYGWLYNVSGWDAVAVTLRDGKRFALGTDDPAGLSRALGA